MRAVLLVNPGGELEVVDVPRPTPGAGEVLLRVEAAGLCGTDLHIIDGKYPQASFPSVLGHEFAGTVVEVGPGVDGFAVGDRVAADPNQYCGKCEWCLQEAYNLCVDFHAIGIDLPGALAEFVVVPVAFAELLPPNVAAQAGALIEPLSCAIHGFDLSDVRSGKTMLIYGGGTIGLLTLALAKQQDMTVSVVEPHASRRAKALQMGALEAVAPGETLSRDKFDYVVDAAGVPAAIAEGLTRLRPRGTFMQMGAAPDDVTIPLSPYQVFANELRIIGSFSVANCYPRAARMMAQMADALSPLVTHRFGLDQINEALAAMASPDALKVQIDPRM